MKKLKNILNNSFFKGFFSLNMWGNTDIYGLPNFDKENYFKEANKRDADALRSDWEQVGKYMRDAMDKLK